jgi:hypothetical protein
MTLQTLDVPLCTAKCPKYWYCQIRDAPDLIPELCHFCPLCGGLLTVPRHRAYACRFCTWRRT